MIPTLAATQSGVHKFQFYSKSNESRNLFRFTLEGEYEQFKFTEMMIDHLDIESKIIVAECNEAKLQVRKFGIPPPIGKSK